jgi:hypothetical protein
MILARFSSSRLLTDKFVMRHFFLTISLLLFGFSVSGQTSLKPLKTKLDIMDEKSATELFGKSTAGNYYVLTLRLFNELKENGENKDTSIIVYENSIRLAVNLEKRAIKSNPNKQWTKVDIKSELPGESFNSGCENTATAYRPLSYEIVSSANSPLKLKGKFIQNALSMSLKPLEEIPFGSDITRILFVPKQPIKGIIQNHDVRISRICSNFVKGKAVIIKQNTSFEF